MRLHVKIDGLDAMRERLGRQAKQVDYAAMIAINNVAFSARNAVKAEIKRVFDNPTPWVVGGLGVIKAKRDRLTATVHLDEWGNKQGVSVDKILSAEIHGGQRGNKRHEIALNRAGILPDGMQIVPGEAAKRDRYGNMSSGQIVQIISYFWGFGEQGYEANMTSKGRWLIGRDKKRSGKRGIAYFALQKRRGKLPAGVYQRVSFGALGSAVKPVMIFIKKPAYRARLDPYKIAQNVVSQTIDAEFEKAFAHAMRTAR